MTTTTQRFQLEPAAVEKLRRNFHGELIERSHPAYGEHRRLWNGSIDRYPTVITRCADTADVCAAVRFARRLGMPLAVRSGGHSFPGLSVCDDGIVVDLHMMCEIHVDPEHSTARRRTVSYWASWTRRRRSTGWRCRPESCRTPELPA
ncbi:MAG TPA: FAD-dependent oxidoreductase [Propionibacteriaceae bacterium]